MVHCSVERYALQVVARSNRPGDYIRKVDWILQNEALRRADASMTQELCDMDKVIPLAMQFDSQSSAG